MNALRMLLPLLAIAILGEGLHPAGAAERKTQNVVLITADGLRWQEMFRGAEASLMTRDPGGVRDTNGLAARFWRETPESRREALFPFLWGRVAREGQLLGNQDKGSVIRVTNGRNFSYPGYSEFLTGVADSRIVSNSKLPNPNTNVFEWLSGRPGFRGRVGAVVNWDVIPWILNVERSHIPVWSGYPLPPKAVERIEPPAAVARLMEATTPIWKDVILDAYTAQAAVEHVAKAKPRLLYVAFGETDEWAHDGRYDLYLGAAHNVDRFAARLWEQMERMPEYRGKTTFIITTDHGRGVSPVRWKNHGAEIEESGAIWMAVIGPDTQPLGERSQLRELTQGGVAATIAALVGEDFRSAVPEAAPPVEEVLRP